MLWSPHKTCQFLGISPSTLRRWRKQDATKLGARKLTPTGHWRYEVAKIKAFAAPQTSAVDLKRQEILTRAQLL